MALPAPAVAIAQRFEPYLVEVILPFPLGSADEAVAAAAQMVQQLLAQPNLGQALAESADLDDDSPRVATTAFVQAQLREFLQREVAEVIQAALADLITSPGKLKALLPTERPAATGALWDNGGTVAISGDYPDPTV